MPYLTSPIVVFGLTGSFGHITENRKNVGVAGNAIGQEPTYGSISSGAGLGGSKGSGGGASGIGGPGGGGGFDAAGGMGLGGQNAYQPTGSQKFTPFPPTTNPPPQSPTASPIPAYAGGGAGGYCPGAGNCMSKPCNCHQGGNNPPPTGPGCSTCPCIPPKKKPQVSSGQ